MPYKDPAVRRERRRVYMREFMRKRRAEARAADQSPSVAMSTVPDPASPGSVRAAFSQRKKPTVSIPPVSPPPRAPSNPSFQERAMAKKWLSCIKRPEEPETSKARFRAMFRELAAKHGLTPVELEARL